MKRIYIGNLSLDTTDETLRKLLEHFGVVETALVIINQETGQSRGYGFVEMSSADTAQEAITALHGTQFDGMTLNVNEACPRADPQNKET